MNHKDKILNIDEITKHVKTERDLIKNALCLNGCIITYGL